MEATDIFTFCQNDLQVTSFAAFEEMRRKGQFCDLTIKVQNRSILAHRIIVAAGIPYFQSAFEFPESDNKEKEIAVQDSLDPTALESLILFAYTSKVNITTENVQSLLVTAHFLELDNVRDSCAEFISRSLNIHNVGQLRKLASSLKNSYLIDNCNCFIRKNFEEFSKSSDFFNLSHTGVKEILMNDDLVVSSEEVVFEAMMEWVKFSPLHRQDVLPELLTEVRLIYLPAPYLMTRVDTEELIINSKPCKDLVNEVKYYHFLPEMTTEFVNLKTRPRNYFMSNLFAVCSYKVSDSKRLFIFTLANERWVPLSSEELECSVHNAVAVNRKIYMLLDETILIFNTENEEWEMLKASHENISGTATVLHEGKIYCFGAEDDRFINKMRFFDTKLNTWSQTTEMKTNRWDSAAASLGQFIYVTGGYDNANHINSVEKYCPSRDTWTDVAPMLIPRDNHGCTSMTGKIYICGGMNTLDSTLKAAEMYDPVIGQWNYIASMQYSKNVISLVPHCGRMYAFGETDIEAYDPENNEWNRCSFVPMELLGAVSLSIHANQNELT